MMSVDFTSLFDASPNAYMVLDRELRYVAANREYLRVTGATLEELIGVRIFERFPNDPDDPNNAPALQLRRSFEQVLETGKPDAIPFVRYRVQSSAEGPTRDAFWSATHTPIFDHAGRTAYVLQHTMNVSRLREAAGFDWHEAVGPAQMVQQAFRVLDDGVEVASLLEQSPGFMAFLRGPTHVFTRTNEAYQRLIDERDVLGIAVADALPEVVSQGFVTMLDTVFESGEPYVGKGVRLQLASGPGGDLADHYVDFVYQPIRDDSGVVSGVFVHGTDVTERERALEVARAAQRLAEDASRLKDEFLSTVSHELRTPLNAMLGWLNLLQNGSLDADGTKRALEIVERNARSQFHLVEDLLDIGRIVSGNLRMHVDRIDLSEAIAMAVEAVRPAADSKNITIQVVEQRAAVLMADPHRLQQIVWNLLSNAVKFTPGEGRVRVVLDTDQGSAVLSVADDGPGVPDEFKPYAFDRFRQQDQEITRAQGGLGLGLAIAKDLVELHGGSIAVADAEGGGALFVVRLPLVDASPLDAPPDSGSRISSTDSLHPELQDRRVLLVEDEDDTREFVSLLLLNAGCAVLVATTAQEALGMVTAERPDLIISDIGMPGMDGYSFIRHVRQLERAEGGHTLALALTAYARPEDRARALRAGFQNHVPKPVDAVELVEAVASLVRWLG